MDYLSGQGIVYTSENYEGIYITMNEKYNIKYHELFILAASIGFKNNKRSPLNKNGREFRLSYFTQEQKAVVYTILLLDDGLSIDTEDLLNKEMFRNFTKALEEYAEGGMDILIENALPANINKNTSEKEYNDYIVDIMSYLHKTIDEATFWLLSLWIYSNIFFLVKWVK